MQKNKLLGFCLLLVYVLLNSSCSLSGNGADYTVRGNESIYEETDARVFVTKPIIDGLMDDGIHDPKNEAVNTLQQPTDAMAAFPLDRRGAINWVVAIDTGIINPRMSLRGKDEMNIMDMDVIFKNTGEMPWVRFPHLAHTRWLDCSNCHPAIFIPQRGANKVGMDAIIAGQYCGRCHDKVAFPLWTCERCHSVTHEGSPQAWWRDRDKPMNATNTEKQRLHHELDVDL
ncbi:MAG: hypothetical protein OEZ58_12490 [Gammaproteobacteria bacterium]|nr:hypothetical protein [Gammaproteobacteria bacterium]MDH5729804.1 hypothetical protein [Gammaproteobacteria bacterium]